MDVTAIGPGPRTAGNGRGRARRAKPPGAGAKAGRKPPSGAGQQEALGAISQLALRPVEPAEFILRCSEAVAVALGIDQMGIFELSPDGKLLSLAGGFGWLDLPAGPNALPAAACRPLSLALSAGDAVAFEGRDMAAVRGSSRSGCGVALPIGERSTQAGVLTVAAAGEGRAFTQGEISFLRTVAFIVAAVWERHRAQAVLMLRNRALEELDQGIMITDARRIDNPLIYVNPAFERLTGYRAEDVLGRNPRFLQGAETDRQALNGLRRALADATPFRGPIINHRRDGTAFWNDLAISAVRGPGGEATHHVGILSDITERMRLEAQLRQAQKMEAIGHLTGGIAHDFNNLLAVILGNSEILLEDATDEEQRETIHLVVGTAERGAVLTQRLLAFGRRQALRPEPVEVGEALSSLCDMLQRTLGEQVQLATADDGTGINALVDRTLFESAIVNLAVNARDAMPGGGRLTISSRAVRVPDDAVVPELAGGADASVSVVGPGAGMPPDVLARAFEPVFTTKDVGKGSGLGLAMVYGFIRQSGGQVTIESRVGEGTSVSLYLPVAAPRVDRRARQRKYDDPLPLGSERILLVEDEREVRRFVSRALARLGYGVLEAEDATTAIAILEQHPDVDLLFSDLILPGAQDGLRLVERARDLKPGIKVLLTTGYTEQYERIAKSSPGLILRKPYRRQQLAHTLRRVLDAACAGKETAGAPPVKGEAEGCRPVNDARASSSTTTPTCGG
jgi:PAS domain S-box-containing protein